MNSNHRLLPTPWRSNSTAALTSHTLANEPLPRQQSGRTRRVIRRRGVTAVEFAMVAPVFMIVIAVCGEVARLSMMRNIAQNASYEAARFVMSDGAKVSDGIARAREILARVGTVNAVVTINGSDGTLNSSGVVTNELGVNTQAITCAIQIPLRDNSSIIPSYVFGDTKIRSNMTVRTERYRGYYDGVSTQ